jgi:hypothetical protein
VAKLPDKLTAERHLELRGREWMPWARRAVIASLAVVPLLGLLNLFGQRPATVEAAAPAASLKLYAPTTVRSGLYFEARFHIKAMRDLKQATLVLDPGWLEGMTLNTVEPAPVGEASRDGRIALDLGHIPAGGEHILFLQFQVNPTNVGRRSQRVSLEDGTTPILTIDRDVTIWP